MVNCNPETVSTDYDTSDRLYFEPLGAEEVLAVCEREQPEGVVIQFGGQTPLKLARPIEAGGFRILGTPYEAIDLAEDRERFGELLGGPRDPLPGVGDRRGGGARRRRSRTGSATRCSCGRPTSSAGGRCASATAANEVVEAFHADLRGKVLVDRFVENAIEIDVDALCDGDETYVAAVMQHVEEAGVHSGDSACVLPAPSLDARPPRARSRTSSGRLAPALGTVGLINVQLAVAEDGRSTCSRQTRARRGRCRSRRRRPGSTWSRRPAASRPGRGCAISRCRPSGRPRR